ncbi:MAG TPA: hypothetical protein VK212_04540 [Lentimicrobium sp.]|nr:hypothetical protein [Lentimicrobium sp.]
MKFLILLSLVCTSIFCSAQSFQDSIVVKKGGNIYMVNGKVLSYPELISLTSSNQAAYEEIWKAKSNSGVANVFGFLGGALVGWPIGTAIGGGKPQWAIAGAGVGLIAIAIPFAVTAKKQTIRAIRIYNAGIKINAEKDITLKAGIYNDGIGFALKF